MKTYWMSRALLLSLLAVGACIFPGDGDGTEGTDRLTPEIPLPIAVGRSFGAHRFTPATDERGLKRVYPSIGGETDDDDWDVFSSLVEQWCQDQTRPRFDSLPDTGGAPGDEIPFDCRAAIRDQQELLCVASELLTMSESPLSTEIRAPGYAGEGPLPAGTVVELTRVSTDGDDDGSDPPPLFRVPPQSVSDAATLSLVASEYYRWSLLVGSISFNYCEEGYLSNEVPAGRRDGEGGVSSDATVPVAFVVINGMSEALFQMRQAVDISTEQILGAAEARRARDRDARDGVINSWRALFDSRLEVANRLVGVPPRMFEPDPSLLVEIDGDLMPIPAFGDFPVVESQPIGLQERRAEDLIRVTRVDPRSADIPGVVLAALFEDYPADFPDPSTTAPADYFPSVGIAIAALERSANRLTQESAARGRPIVPEHVLRGEPAPTDAVPRVVGTAKAAGGADPAYLYALTAGGVRIDAPPLDEAWATLTMTMVEPHQPGIEYAFRSIYGTLDYASWSLVNALGRGDVSGLPEEQLQTITRSTRTITSDAATEVPLRADLCVSGQLQGSGTHDLEAATLHLYGVGSEVSGTEVGAVYELWWSEEGLACATGNGEFDGVPCDIESYRLPLSDSALRSDGGASGHGDYYVWLEFSGSTVPIATREGYSGSGMAEARGRVYLTRKLADQREALGGFDVRPVVDETVVTDTPIGPWSRCTQYPLGTPILRELGSVLGASVTQPSKPKVSCAGLPTDLRLPLEDELTEASTGEDEIESSFAHYLALAREAATRADALGEQLVEEGLQMDLRAEAARDELENICGDVLNVPDLILDGTTACDASSPCPIGQRCFAGSCVEADVSGMLPESESVEPLETCVGSGSGELVTVSFGIDPLCIYRKPGQPICECDSSMHDCPPCPIRVPEAECAIGPGSPFASLTGAGFEAEFTVPLRVVDPVITTYGEPDCHALARARGRILADGGVRSSTREASLEDARDQSWLNLDEMRRLAESLSVRRQPYGHVEILRSGRVWHPTGDLHTDATTAFPCSPHLNTSRFPEFSQVLEEIGCNDSTPPRAGRSLLCGLDCTLTYVSGADGGAYYRPAGERLAGAVRELGSLALMRGRATVTSPLNIDADTVSGDPCWGIDSIVPLPDLPTGSAITSSSDALIAYRRRSACGEWPRSPVGWCVKNDALTGPDSELESVFSCPFIKMDNAPALERRVDDERLLAWWDPNPNREGTVRDFVGDVWRTGSGELATVRHRSATVTVEGGSYGTRPLLGDTFDALELACLAASTGGSGCASIGDELPTVRSASDFPVLARAVRCLADDIEHRAARMTLTDLPVEIADDVQQGSVSATYPRFRGDYGQTVSELRGAMESIGSSISQAAAGYRQFSAALEIAQSELTILDLEDQIRAQQLIATQSSQLSRCAAAMAPTVSVSGGTTGVSVGVSQSLAFLPICADSVVQMSIANNIADLEDDISDERQRQVLTNLALSFSTASDTIGEASRRLAASYANVNRLLAKLDQDRSRARRALSRALFLDQDEVGREFSVNRVMRARYSTVLERYRRARTDAVRMSWIAKEAVEQRLAVDLSDISANMTLVPAPATWSSEVCATTGINYSDIRGGRVESFADEYIGDYVTKLENFVQSYRLDFPFEDGSDVTVLSLKNDLLGVRTSCPVSGPNLLRWSVDISDEAWNPECSAADGRCPVVTNYADTPYDTDEVRLALGLEPVAAERLLGDAGAYAITLGCPESARRTDGSCEPTPGSGAALSQEIFLEEGSYLFSWYEKLPTALGISASCPEITPTTEPRLLPTASGTAAVPTIVQPRSFGAVSDFLVGAFDPSVAACRWRRAYAVIRNPTAQVVNLGWMFREVPTDSNPSPSVEMSAPQLEEIEPSLDTVLLPIAFFPTDDDTEYELPLCEDPTGQSFRSPKHWARKCEYVCPDGFGGTCSGTPTPDRALLRCFWETEFAIGLPQIERGELVPTGGLALGNFNYRHSTFAVNLVGTGIRDCSMSTTPSSCYSSGFIPYSLRHEGPYRVRNHNGDVVEAPLFTGNVEQAKALAAERYVTNPLSSADQSLLSSYWRGEYRGRPLDGRYRLRVFDTDGLQWSRLEDVQLIVNYKYWTRFE